jgi:hypothetical protein
MTNRSASSSTFAAGTSTSCLRGGRCGAAGMAGLTCSGVWGTAGSGAGTWGAGMAAALYGMAEWSQCKVRVTYWKMECE